MVSLRPPSLSLNDEGGWGWATTEEGEKEPCWKWMLWNASSAS